MKQEINYQKDLNKSLSRGSGVMRDKRISRYQTPNTSNYSSEAIDLASYAVKRIKEMKKGVGTYDVSDNLTHNGQEVKGLFEQDYGKNGITLNKKVVDSENKKDIIETLVHELSHEKDDKEGKIPNLSDNDVLELYEKETEDRALEATELLYDVFNDLVLPTSYSDSITDNYNGLKLYRDSPKDAKGIITNIIRGTGNYFEKIGSDFISGTVNEWFGYKTGDTGITNNIADITSYGLTKLEEIIENMKKEKAKDSK